LDLVKIKNDIKEKFGSASETDVASYAMYPKVFEDYRKFVSKYSDLSVLPTRYFLAAPNIGEEFHVELEKGKVLILKLLAIGPLSEQTGQREVFYEMNGEVRQVTVDDNKAAVDNLTRAKADPSDSSQVGAPMSGVVVEIRVHDGHEVKKGDPIAVLSAMKMVRVLFSLSVFCFFFFFQLPIFPQSHIYLDRHQKLKAPPNIGSRKWLYLLLIMARLQIFRSERAIRLTARIWCARLQNRQTCIPLEKIKKIK
jgi:biotin carboxyl carrier protein